MKQNLVSHTVFFATVIVVLISLTSVIFPALIVRTTSSIQDTIVDPFETGVWFVPLFSANLIILGIGIMYHKKRLPRILYKAIEFIFNFEVSRKTAFVIIALLFTLYIGLSVNELAKDEGEDWDDYFGVRASVAKFTIDDLWDSYGFNFKYFYLVASLAIFENIRIIPFIATILLLALTYFFTVELTKKRFAGIISLVILLQSYIFWLYDTLATYANFWVLFYLLSLYLIYKKWYLSPISYIFSVFSKALSAVYFPMTVFFIYRTNLPRKKKIQVAISYAIPAALFIAVSNIPDLSLTTNFQNFNYHNFWVGFTSLAFQARFDGLMLIFLLPLVVGLFIASKHNIAHADSIMFLIMILLFSAPLLSGFTYLTNQPYRWIILVVFFAIGVGILLSKRSFNGSGYSPN